MLVLIRGRENQFSLMAQRASHLLYQYGVHWLSPQFVQIACVAYIQILLKVILKDKLAVLDLRSYLQNVSYGPGTYRQ